MTKAELINISQDLLNNYQNAPLSEELSSLLGTDEFCFFDAPLVGVAAADDPVFEKMKEPQIIGEHFITPLQWLENAKSVISFFVPYTAAVRKANSTCPKEEIAPEYIFAKNYAVPYIDALTEKLVSAIKAEGYSAVVPSLESDRMKTAVITPDGSRLKFTSGWSERHAAYACGLGTFGISGGLITAKGVAGRYISIVTDMPLEADERPYTDPYEYCTLCGACIVRCPGDAITVEDKKDKAKCSAFVNTTKEKFAPLYGCAKCQCGVPCANGIPKKKKS